MKGYCLTRGGNGQTKVTLIRYGKTITLEIKARPIKDALEMEICEARKRKRIRDAEAHGATAFIFADDITDHDYKSAELKAAFERGYKDEALTKDDLPF